MKPSAFTQMAGCLKGDQTPRVWSLLATVFGELGQELDARIPASLLGELMAPVGIKREAMRVALHRLKRDGWIESQRRGRSSEYFLTSAGRHESSQASPKIYNLSPPARQAWLVIKEPSGPPGDAGLGDVQITSNMILTAKPPADPELFQSPVDPKTGLPGWMAVKLCDPQIIELSGLVAARFDKAFAILQSSPPPGPLERAVLRILIVHNWRRVALRAPALPDDLLPQGWAGERCRARLGQLLNRLAKPSLEELQTISPPAFARPFEAAGTGLAT